MLQYVLHDLRLAWRQLLATEILCHAAILAVSLPLTAIAGRLLIAASGDDALANTEIATFLLSPIGLASVIGAGGVSLGLVALEQSAIMAIGLLASRDQHAAVGDVLAFTLRRAPRIVDVATRVVGHTLLLAAPFLGAAAAAYLLLLTESDINFYLRERPPALWVAAVTMGVILVAMLVVVVPRLAAWLFGIPLVLFEGTPPRDALSLAALRVRPHRRAVLTCLLTWAAVSTLISAASAAGVNAFVRLVLPPFADRYVWLVVALAAALLLWTLANLLVSLVTSLGFGLMGARLYLRVVSASIDLEHVGSQPRAPRALGLPARALVGLVVASVLAALGSGTYLLNGVHIDTEAVVIAHRGASAAAPENTLAAFSAAIQQGADLVELDVQETADGQVVVIHDRDLMRIGRTNLRIADARVEQLAGIDVGTWFDARFADQRVPTLEEVLRLCKNQVGVVVELKSYGRDQQLEARVAGIIERTGMQGQVVLMSLEYPLVRGMKALRPDWTVGLLTATVVGRVVQRDADFLAVTTRMATPAFIRSAHRAGKQVFVWTVNDPMTMALLITGGADGLITDRPGAARQVLEQMGTATTGEQLLLGLAYWFGIRPSSTDVAREI